MRRSIIFTVQSDRVIYIPLVYLCQPRKLQLKCRADKKYCDEKEKGNKREGREKRGKIRDEIEIGNKST